MAHSNPGTHYTFIYGMGAVVNHRPFTEDELWNMPLDELRALADAQHKPLIQLDPIDWLFEPRQA